MKLFTAMEHYHPQAITCTQEELDQAYLIMEGERYETDKFMEAYEDAVIANEYLAELETLAVSDNDVYKVTMESINDQLGYPEGTVLSSEVVGKSIGDFAKKVWEKIVAAWRTVSNWIRKLFGMTPKLSKEELDAQAHEIKRREYRKKSREDDEAWERRSEAIDAEMKELKKKMARKSAERRAAMTPFQIEDDRLFEEEMKRGAVDGEGESGEWERFQVAWANSSARRKAHKLKEGKVEQDKADKIADEVIADVVDDVEKVISDGDKVPLSKDLKTNIKNKAEVKAKVTKLAARAMVDLKKKLKESKVGEATGDVEDYKSETSAEVLKELLAQVVELSKLRIPTDGTVNGAYDASDVRNVMDSVKSNILDDGEIKFSTTQSEYKIVKGPPGEAPGTFKNYPMKTRTINRSGTELIEFDQSSEKLVNAQVWIQLSIKLGEEMLVAFKDVEHSSPDSKVEFFNEMGKEMDMLASLQLEITANLKQRGVCVDALNGKYDNVDTAAMMNALFRQA